MCLLEVRIEAEANWKLIDGFLEIFDAGVAYSSQVKVFRQILFSLFNAAIDVIMSLFPIFKINMDDSAMVEQVGAIRIETTTYLHLFQGFNQNFCPFDFIFALAVIELVDKGHCGVYVRLHFLRVDIGSFFEFVDTFLKSILLIT